MSETISLPLLISRLSKETGADANTSRIFVREFFATIAEGLATGATLEIPGLGTFRKSTEPTDDGEPRILFRPDSSLATDVNAPFAAFEAREVPDDVTDADLAAEGPTEEPTEEPIEEAPEIVVENQVEEVMDHSDEQPLVESVEVLEDEPQALEEELPPPIIIDEEPDPEPIREPEPIIEPEPEPVVPAEPEPVVEPEPIATEPEKKSEPVKPAAEAPKQAAIEEPVPSFPEDDEDDDLPLPEPADTRNNGWIWILIAALVIGIGAGVYFGLTIDISSDSDEPLLPPTEQAGQSESEEPAATEVLPQETASAQAPAASSTPAAPTEAAAAQTSAASAAAEEPVYETIGKGNYLSTIARKHYGSDVYWVYIYEANADKIRNPDNVPAGLVVVVPPRSSFPPAADEAEARAIARRKANEIRSRR